MTLRRLLVFNFFGGIKDRGIPIYAQDLAECGRRLGFRVFELRCPRWLGWLPNPLLNLLFVACEQIAAPLIAMLLRCDLTIYPYNSASLVDAWLSRSVIVVHDFIPNSSRISSLSARYVRVTQGLHCRMKRPVCVASEHTLARLSRLNAFAQCPVYLWPNPFYSFEVAASGLAPHLPQHGNRKLRVLLCSGMGSTKDYGGAMKLFRHSHALADAELRILGFGPDASLALRRVSLLPRRASDRITVLPSLSTEQVAAEYAASDLVWVHSLNEGFGRSIIEARLLGRRVLASDIGAFRRLAWMDLTLYGRRDDFDERIAAALAQPPHLPAGDFLHTLHTPLEEAMRKVVEECA